ncbi:MAG: hypothetical protein KDN19_23605, partial [Verrucomicrobiae bacterium]|nr:hypothetical protein [Verrucomicrobiae bacterium]
MTRRTGNARIVTRDELAIHPEDARKKGVKTGDSVRVLSARGEVTLVARVSDEVKPGIVYTTFHFPEHLVNNLTSDIHCDDTLCPEYKVTSVNFEKIAATETRAPARETGVPAEAVAN